VAEVRHIKEPQKLPPVLSPEEVKRVLTMATSLKARTMLTNQWPACVGLHV
jgi:site-specific recombinase XerD